MSTHQQSTYPTKRDDFAMFHLKGSIGRAIVETFFLASGYEVYPFGYENHYANITRFIKRSDSDETMMKVRAMPDLLVYDRQQNESFLLEIKTSSVQDESKFFISKNDLDTYRKHWPESILVIYCIFTTNIYCCKIQDIQPNKLQQEYFGRSQTLGYILKLGYFPSLPTYFRRIKSQSYRKLRSEIIETLKAYTQLFIKSC